MLPTFNIIFVHLKIIASLPAPCNPAEIGKDLTLPYAPATLAAVSERDAHVESARDKLVTTSKHSRNPWATKPVPSLSKEYRGRNDPHQGFHPKAFRLFGGKSDGVSCGLAKS